MASTQRITNPWWRRLTIHRAISIHRGYAAALDHRISIHRGYTAALDHRISIHRGYAAALDHRRAG
jgi:hypothetical protein